MQQHHIPIPVTILSGFLGAGKTSLLNRLLKSHLLAGAMVLINEFGEIAVDHLLVEAADDTIITLSNGCLCCTIRSDLLDRLSELLTRINNGYLPKPSHLVIETTGLADPVPLLQLFMAHPLLLHGFHHPKLITVVDGVNGIKTLEHYGEARRQVALADRLVVSKSDLLPDKGMLRTLLSQLEALNEAAEILVSTSEQENNSPILRQILQGEIFKRDRRHDLHEANAPHHEHHHSHDDHNHDKNRHGETINSFSLEYDQPLPIALINHFLGILQGKYGDHLLRLKGLVLTSGRPDQPLVIHGVQGLFYPPQFLSSWPDPSRQTRLIFIVDDIDEQEIKALFGSFSGQIGIDRADSQALCDNPLAIVGLKF